MEELEIKILDIVGKSKKASLDRRGIEKALGLSSSADFARLSGTLDRMEEELLLVRSKQNKYMTRLQAGLIEGVLSVSKKGTGYIDRDGEPSLIIYPDDLKDALHGDTVLVQVRKGTDEAAVYKVLKRGKAHYTGTFEMTSKGLQCTVDNEKIRNMQYRVRYGKDIRPVDGLKVELSVERYGTPLRLAVDRVLGHKDDPGVDILAVLSDHDIKTEYPEAVLKQANSYEQAVSEKEMEGREDLRGILTVTIDGDDAKDFDDAVSAEAIPEGWLVRVSIADVSHYVTEGSPLDAEAYERGTSVYVLNKVVGMLPHALSNGICSLNPKEDRLANTCEMIVAKDGTVVSYRVYPSVICSDERLTYKGVNRLFEGDDTVDEKYKALKGLLFELRDCARAIRRQRIANGAMDFDSSEAEIRLDEKGKPVYIGPAERGESEMLIEDLMIAANVCVAKLMRKNDIPALYRIHEEPEVMRMKSFQSLSYHLGNRLVIPKGGVTPKVLQEYLKESEHLEAYPVLSNQLLRCMQKAKYDPVCVGHFSLAEESYLHFTSPIRRYPDLIVHRMLRKYYYEYGKHDADLWQDRQRMKDCAVQSSLKERNADDAEWEAEDMKKAEYMAAKIGSYADGIISTVTSYGFYVKLPDTIEGMVSMASLGDDYYHFDGDTFSLVGEKTKKRYMIGQKVRVKVTGADKDSGRIDFEVARPPMKKAAPRKRAQTNSRSGRRTSGGRSNGRKK